MYDHDKFQAGNGARLARNSYGKADGGVGIGDGETVACDRDRQPHGFNSHFDTEGRSVPCERPVQWTARGLKAPKQGNTNFEEALKL